MYSNSINFFTQLSTNNSQIGVQYKFIIVVEIALTMKRIFFFIVLDSSV